MTDLQHQERPAILTGTAGGIPLESLPVSGEMSWVLNALSGWRPKCIDPELVMECAVLAPLTQEDTDYRLRILASYRRPDTRTARYLEIRVPMAWESERREKFEWAIRNLIDRTGFSECPTRPSLYTEFTVLHLDVPAEHSQ